ncbi:MAG TPA: Ig-like domain-containing protein [Aeromicrobium sp.]|nr:Ig-like domain-containing protein [Aeromicrobium sp.]
MRSKSLVRSRRALAWSSATALAAGLLAFVPTSAAQADETPVVPTVSVSKVSFFADETATVTVTGTGFNPDSAIGARPPLKDKKSGAYVIFGKFAANWKPSAGAPSSARKVANQVWALPEPSLSEPTLATSCANGGCVELKSDGSFTTTISVSKAAADTAAGTDQNLVNYGIYTLAGSGAVVADYETYTPIEFVKHESNLQLADAVAFAGSTKSLTATLATGATGNVTLSGLPDGNLVSPVDDGVATFTVPANLPIGSYELSVSYEGDDNYARSEHTANLRVVTSTPSVTVSTTEFQADEVATITVEGSGFDPSAVTSLTQPLVNRPAGVSITFSKFSEEWQPSKSAPAENRLRNNNSLKWAVLAEDSAAVGGPAAGAIELKSDGTFTAELTVDKAALDELVPQQGADQPMRYGIYTYAGGVNTKHEPYETFTPIKFKTTVDTAGLNTTFGKGGSLTLTTSAEGTVNVPGLGEKSTTDGKVTFSVPTNTAVGSKTYTATFTPSDGAFLTSTKSFTVTVAKATVSTSAKVTKKPTKRKTGSATIYVAGVRGVTAPSGAVTLKLTKGKSAKYVRATVRNGAVKVSLPKLAKGKWTVQAAYGGNANYNARGYAVVGSIKVTK